MIRAEVIADSVSPLGDRLTTVVVDLHRFVLAELNTHRAMSRNSASSRAIPLAKRIEAVRTDPAMPIEWGRNQPGMQAETQLEGDAAALCEQHWRRAATHAAGRAERMAELGLHKQVAARILEPFLWHRVVISATDWRGFFAQRCSPLAQPEMRAAAEAIRDAIRASTPQVLGYGGWHTPFVGVDDYGPEFDAAVEQHGFRYVVRAMSVARCARVSYLNEGKRDIAADLNLYSRLISARPPHASPFEHVATPSNLGANVPGNFTGWSQLRHVLGLDEIITGEASEVTA